MYYLFNANGEWLATADIEPNMEDLASRGEQAVKSEQHFANPILSNGKIVERGEPPSPFHYWNGKAWAVKKAQQQAVLSAEKSAKLGEINRKAQEFVNNLAKLDETPDFERETWSIQREEAKAWFADKRADTPTLALIAQMRGVPLNALRQKAYEKAMAYQTVAALVAGQRQGYEDRLNAAADVEAVRAIVPEYQLPQGGSDD